MIPPENDPVWRKIVLDDKRYDFEFLALRIFMSRIKMRLDSDDSDRVVDGCVGDLYRFACEHREFVEADIERIRG